MLANVLPCGIGTTNANSQPVIYRWRMSFEAGRARAARTEAADNGAQAINRILLASVSGSGALVESGKASGARKALQTKLGGTDVD
ncbi:hypothetical protein [Ralstonia wenshanensis]|uniref:hypothetical protein n=1 Tax=Ralstonia wenshanensis TaxID=2842456 RepID=UPI0021B26B33|nr:hypothetical protein [Ralstonia wenshanensis]MCT7308416.1 hypothetical protein [Ralstonia wenshanensis]